MSVVDPTVPALANHPIGEDRGSQLVVADAWVLLAAAATAIGAAMPRTIPWAAVLTAFVLALVWRRPATFVLVLLLSASLLSARAWAGLDPAVAGAVQGRAVLVTDPERKVVGTTAVARLDGQRVQLWAHGRSAGALRHALAGDVVQFQGTRQTRSSVAIAADPWRRVVGSVELTTVLSVQPGSWPFSWANEVHRRLEHGAASMPSPDRALLAGLVLGDDRAQSPVMRYAFAVVGLGHLLAVSGQNVAFVLAAAAPVLRRFRLRTRFVVVVTLLGFFALVTRFEPSVLRAVVMAGLAAAAASVGRPASGLRVLCLAVIGLLLVDPLLVRALGFQLSVSASAGILVLAPAISRWLALPAGLGTALAVPLSAQLATAPLLAGRTGGLSLVSLPANVLAGPAAGLVMTWGSSAGLLAGYLPGPLAALLGLPSRVLLWWIATVAVTASRLPAAQVGLSAVVVALALATPWWWWTARRARSMAYRRRSVALVLAVGLWLGAGPLEHRAGVLPAGVRLHRQGLYEVLVVTRPVDGSAVLRALRGRISGELEIVVVSSSARGAWQAGAAVMEVYRPGLVLAPVAHPGVTLIGPGDQYVLGQLHVNVGSQASIGSSSSPLAIEVTGDEADSR